MGRRTIVILDTDRACDWENDPELGKKIARARSHATGERSNTPQADLGYGQVAECAHTDLPTVAIIDGLSLVSLHSSAKDPAESKAAMLDRLFLEAAQRLGFAVKKLTANITKAGIEVRAGQIWQDCDTRMGNRHGKVLEVRDGKVIMNRSTATGQIINDREIRIALSRLRPTSTGWTLVRDVQ